MERMTGTRREATNFLLHLSRQHEPCGFTTRCVNFVHWPTWHAWMEPSILKETSPYTLIFFLLRSAITEVSSNKRFET